MLKGHWPFLNGVLCVVELLVVLCAFPVIYYAEFGLGDISLFDLLVHHKVLVSVYCLIWIYLSNHFQLYVTKRFVLFIHEAWNIIRATASCMIITSFVALFMNYPPPNLSYLEKTWVLQVFSLLFMRIAVRSIYQHIRARAGIYRRVLIVGRNTRSLKLVREIQATPESGILILGFVDAPGGNTRQDGSHDFKLLGDLEHLDEILKDQVVDEVFVTLPVKSFYSEIERIIQLCETIGLKVKIPTDLFNPRLSKSSITHYFDIPFIDLYTGPEMNWQLLAKRLIDLCISLLLIIFLLPFLIVVSILIKTTSKGPVFFRQERVGYNGRLFSMLKFRTMVENAEVLKEYLLTFNEMDGPVFKMENDPRVTTVGRLLRKTGIDELPQLINVVLGDMSLVGPRPPLLDEVRQYDLKDRRRLSMKPGITGTWQVSGRNSIPFEKWMEMDRDYIDHWSLWFDIKVLAKTIPALLRGLSSAKT
jgi:exopolysaccharide biosynthesis polyprenyl glycosylphosphotransferase